MLEYIYQGRKYGKGRWAAPSPHPLRNFYARIPLSIATLEFISLEFCRRFIQSPRMKIVMRNKIVIEIAVPTDMLAFCTFVSQSSPVHPLLHPKGP